MKRIALFCVLASAFSCSAEPLNKSFEKDDSREVISYASFLPENTYSPKNYFAAGNVTEQDFEDVLEAIREIYTPIFENFGATLSVEGDYSDDTVNAYANQDGKNWQVRFFGGLAKHPYMTKEGFAMVACHEIGHHIGGYPFYQGQKMSNEGNSDYFAAISCARKMFDPASPIWFIGNGLWKNKKPNPQPQPSTCSSLFLIDKQVCQMTLDAGLSLGKVLADLNKEKLPSYSTPDKTIVKKTADSHPKAQCRLDSYLAGTMCPNEEWSDSKIPRNSVEMKAVSCDNRPKCWFAK
jgi:hypothetical protein